MRRGKLNNLWSGLVAAWLLLTVSATAQAQGYIGAGFGQSKSSDLASDIEFAFEFVLGVTPTVDDKDNGWKVFGGSKINPNFAVELAFVDLGEFKGNGGGVTLAVEPTGFNVAAVGIAPVGQATSVFGKLGLFNWDADVAGSGPAGNVLVSESGTDVSFGLGIQFDFTKSTGLRVEWERFDLDGSAVDFLSLGVLLAF